MSTVAFSPLLLNLCHAFNHCRHLHGAVDSKTPDVVHIVDPTYSFEVLGGIGQKSYIPVVVFHGASCGLAPARLASRVSLDMSTCVLALRPDLVAAVSLTPPTTGCQSALELCNVTGGKQVLSLRMLVRRG